jgi:hypothetical protein
MERKFHIKTLGRISFSLGIHFAWDNNGLTMKQTAYIEKIVTKFNMEECKPLSVPMQKGTKPNAKMSPIDNNGKSKMVDIPYKSAIGSLLYLAMCTRPDIAYAVCALARYSQNPGWEHWTLVKNVIRYVRFTKDLGLFFKKGEGNASELTLSAYCDAAFNDSKTGNSTTGYIVLMSDHYPISWRSKLSSVTALSTMEAELVALHSVTREVIWTRMVLVDVQEFKLPATVIYCDNSPAIQLTRGLRVTEKNKHIRPKFFFVMDCVKEKEVSVVKISTDDQIADILTKAIANPQFSKLRSSFCVRKQGEE